MVKALLIENEIEYHEDGNDIIAKFNENSVIRVSFNSENLIEKCSGDLSL